MRAGRAAAILALVGTAAACSSGGAGPLGDMGHAGVLMVNCGEPAGIGRLLGTTWIENRSESEAMTLEGITLEPSGATLVEAAITRVDEQRTWGAGIVLPPDKGDKDSWAFWRAREPLAGAVLEPGEGAVIVLVVAPPDSGEGGSESWELLYRVGSTQYTWERSEGMIFDPSECATEI